MPFRYMNGTDLNCAIPAPKNTEREINGLAIPRENWNNTRTFMAETTRTLSRAKWLT
jgi:hypothetical protein